MTDYTYCEIHATTEDGKTINEKFFDGRLPQIGEAVEMVFVGNRDNGAMMFQLRVCPQSSK